MSVPAINTDIITAVASAASTGDKLTFQAPVACVIQRWGVMAGGTAITGGTLDMALDVLPKSGGARVNAATSASPNFFDTAGGLISDTNCAIGSGAYHEPKFDPSGTVSPGTGVNQLGNQLLLLPGDSAIIEVLVAGTGGATSQFFIEYRPISFQAARDTNFTKVNL